MVKLDIGDAKVGGEGVAELVDAPRLPLVLFLLRRFEIGKFLTRDDVLKLGGHERLHRRLGHAFQSREHPKRVAIFHHATHRTREHLRPVRRPRLLLDLFLPRQVLQLNARRRELTFRRGRRRRRRRRHRRLTHQRPLPLRARRSLRPNGCDRRRAGGLAVAGGETTADRLSAALAERRFHERRRRRRPSATDLEGARGARAMA